MPDISKERLDYLRHQSRPLEPGEPGYVTVRLYAHELRALLDAADERDRLREERARGARPRFDPQTGGIIVWTDNTDAPL